VDQEVASIVNRTWYGVALGALGLLVLLRLTNGNSMLELVGVLLILAAAAIAFLPHHDDERSHEPGAEGPTDPPDDEPG
jgi:hypothetical protein